MKLTIVRLSGIQLLVATPLLSPKAPTSPGVLLVIYAQKVLNYTQTIPFKGFSTLNHPALGVTLFLGKFPGDMKLHKMHHLIQLQREP